MWITGRMPVKLANLEHLGQSKLSKAVHWISKLTLLTDLSASCNQLEFLTNTVGHLQLLHKLNVMSNKLI